jgi:hypothetical protein
VNLLVTFLVVIGATAIAAGLLLVVRRWSPHGGHFTDTTPASGVFTILATFFAVLFAFVVLFAFTAYDQAATAAEVEAETVLQQFETAQLLDGDAGPLLGAQLRCYARSVVSSEWPAMQDGELLEVNEWDQRLFVTLETLEPTSPAGIASYEQWLDQRAAREDARERRALGEQGIVPTPVWFGLLFTAAIVWGFVFLFADRGERTGIQVVVVASVTAMITVGLLVVLFLDNPYVGGAGSIGPTGMERTLGEIDELAALLGVELPELCDDAGRPT